MKQNKTDKFYELLSTFETGVLITHGETTHFHARPMTIAGIEDNCDIWFLTNEDSAKVHEIESDTRAQVICQNGRHSCISIAGHASLNRDRDRIRALWQTPFQAWFPKGVEDPSILLIHFAGEQGEYWDNTGLNGCTYLYRTIKAMVTHEPPEVTEGKQHGLVNLGNNSPAR